ncbi:MAG: hypothetical protein ABS75_10110 [Pelagibacterium sp. SCN 63-23]|nr:MAG: hypothetical protein ABS75_10110 [Pelagibacterium sp. SCN 63-23]
MLNRIALCAAVSMLGASSVLADGKVYVQMPDLGAYQGAEAEQFLAEVVLANVVSSNCAGFEVTDEEWSLLTDSADLLAYGQLKIDTGRYDDEYYRPAFAALDEAGTCEREGPKVEEVLTTLVGHGGSRAALPDQDKGYKDWRKLMDRLSAEANRAGE